MNLHNRARSCPNSRAELVRRVEAGISLGSASEAMGFSRQTGGKWKARFKAEGLSGFHDRSSRPKKIQRTPAATEALVVQLRRARQMIPRISEQLRLPKATVARIVKRHGLSKLPPIEPPPPVVRYEYSVPGAMLHIDTKKLGRFKSPGHRVTGNKSKQVRGAGWDFVFIAIDDCSRTAHARAFRSEKNTSSCAFLREVVQWFAARGVRIERVMTDNGSCFKSTFSKLCSKLGIKHVRTRPYTPRTNGKAERFIQTLLREWAYVATYPSSAVRIGALKHYLPFYNLRRSHSSLGGLAPMDRLRLGDKNLLRLHS